MAKISSFLLGGIQLLAGLFFTATGLGAGLGMKLLLSGALTIASGLVTPTGRDGFKSSPRYGFDNLSNTAHDGGAISVIYGKETVAPQIISLVLDQDGADQVLKMQMLVAEGEIESITDVRINDTPSDQFEDITIEKRLGTPDQTPVPGFNEIGTAWPASTTMSLNTIHVHAMRNASDAVVIGLIWPGGMYARQKDGDLQFVSYSMHVEFKRSSEGNSKWRPALPLLTSVPEGTPPGQIKPGAWRFSGGRTWTHNEQKTESVFRSQLRIEFPDRDKWDIRLIGAQNPHSRWVNIPNLTNFVELLNDERAYPNRAILSLKIPAQGQLSSGTPKVTCLAKGKKIQTTPWDVTVDPVWSRNPVWCLRDFILAERYGLGGWIASADLDDGAGGSWDIAAQACDETLQGLGYGNPHARHELDLVMDTKAPARDWVSQIIDGARLNMYAADGLIRMRHAEAAASVRSFSEDEGDGNRKNILAGTAATSAEDALVSTLVDRDLPDQQKFNVVRVRYIDRYKDYRAQTLEIRDVRVGISGITNGPYEVGEEIHDLSGDWRAVLTREAVNGDDFMYVSIDEGFDGALALGSLLTGQDSSATCTSDGPHETLTPERVLEIQLFGITRGAQALREARYYLNRAQHAPRHCSFAIFLGDQDIEPGDIIEVSAARIDFAAKKFIVMAIQFAEDGTGRLDCREYQASVFKDQVDRIADPPLFANPGDAVTPGARPIAASDSSAAEDVTPQPYIGKKPAIGTAVRVNKPVSPATPSKPSRAPMVDQRSGSARRNLQAAYRGWLAGWGK